MSRGRPENKIPRIEVKVYIRTDILARAKLILLDPVKQKIKYGALTAVFEQLLEEWLERHATPEEGRDYIERELNAFQLEKLMLEGIGFQVLPNRKVRLNAAAFAALGGGDLDHRA